MPDYIDFIFRFITFAAIHSVLASTWLKERVCKKAASQYRCYRLLYNLLSLVMFCWVMLAYRHSTVLYFVPGVLSLSMYLLQLILAVTLFICLQQTDISFFLGFKQWKRQETEVKLVTNGFYGVVRHPLYLLSILLFALTPVMTAQWALLTIGSSIYFIVGAKIEEKRFLDEFGEEYRHYQQTVPFLFPKIKKTIFKNE